jgi:hypothetical protein
MKKYLTIFLFIVISSLAQDDSYFSFPKDTEITLKPITHEIDFSSKIAEMNDTSKLVSNKIADPGKRVKFSIVKYISDHVSDLRYEYNKRLSEIEKHLKNNHIRRKKSLLDGKFTVEIKILSDGSVSSCKPIESTLKDSLLEISLLLRMYKWNFGSIQDKNDTTMVVYPFIFSQ